MTLISSLYLLMRLLYGLLYCVCINICRSTERAGNKMSVIYREKDIEEKFSSYSVKECVLIQMCVCVCVCVCVVLSGHSLQNGVHLHVELENDDMLVFRLSPQGWRQ